MFSFFSEFTIFDLIEFLIFVVKDLQVLIQNFFSLLYISVAIEARLLIFNMFSIYKTIFLRCF